MPAIAKGQALHLSGMHKEMDDMDSYIRWFQRFIWIGIVMNMVFAIPALFAPALLTSMLGMPPQLSDPWLENAGMLLVGISLFYMPSGFNAPRYVVHSWLCVLSRLVAVAFWIYLINTSNQAPVFVPMLMGRSEHVPDPRDSAVPRHHSGQSAVGAALRWLA